MDLKSVLGSVKRVDLDALYNTFVGLPPKQQTVALGAVIGALIIILVLPLSMAAGHLSRLEKKIAKTDEQIESVVTDVQKLANLKNEVKALEDEFTRQTGDSLLTVIQRIASEAGVTADRPAERGRESLEFYEEEKVSFNLKSVQLAQLVRFLHKLESSKERVMRVNELVVAPVYGDRQLLNAEFKEVAAYRLAAEER